MNSCITDDNSYYIYAFLPVRETVKPSFYSTTNNEVQLG